MEITLTSDITVRLIQSVGGDHSVVAAAKVSVCGEDALKFAEPGSADANAGLIDWLMRFRHGTPFEHSSLTFFVHAPIFVWREWHRHRIMSFNEESARYHQLEPVFWVPRPDRKILNAPGHTSARPKFKKASKEEHRQICLMFKAVYITAYSAYETAINVGVSKEVARSVLPVGIYSSCWVTANPRSLMHFLSLRTHEPAAKYPSNPQAEIEEAARACEAVLAEGWPLTHAAFVKHGRVAP